MMEGFKRKYFINVPFIYVSNYLTTLLLSLSLSGTQKHNHHHHYYLHINGSKLCCKIELSIEYTCICIKLQLIVCEIASFMARAISSAGTSLLLIGIIISATYLLSRNPPICPSLARLACSACAHRTDLIKNVVLIKSNAVSQAKCQPGGKGGKGGEGGVAPAVDRQTGSDKDTLQSKMKHLQGLLGLFWGCRGGQ